MDDQPLSYLALLNNFKDGAWYDPSTEQQVSDIVQLLDIKPGEKIADLGAGDGRIVLAVAKAGGCGLGLEKDPKLVDRGNRLIQEAGFQEQAAMIRTNFWDEDLSKYDKIISYQFKTVMPRLEEKLQKELHDGTYVVSNTWKFPNWQPAKQLGDILLYIK